MMLTSRRLPTAGQEWDRKRASYSSRRHIRVSWFCLRMILTACVKFEVIAAVGTSTAATQFPPTQTTSSSAAVAATTATFQPLDAGDKSGQSSTQDSQAEPSSGEPAPVLELLDASLLQQARGVKRHSPTGWHLAPDFPGISLDRQTGGATNRSTHALNLFQGKLAFRFSGILTDHSQGTLLRISSHDAGTAGALPRLEISLDLASGVLVLRYLGVRSFQRMVIPNVFPKQRWMDLRISVDGKRVKVAVDCKKMSTFTLRQAVGALPRDAVISFGAQQTGQQGLQGIVFSAQLFYTSHILPDSCQPYTESSDLNLSPVSDESSTQSDDSQAGHKRLLALEQKFVELSLIVESLQTENVELKRRVSHLETCECRPSCSHQGALIQEGGTWSPEPCTLCTCVNNMASCAPRLDVASCTDPCLSDPCLNSGECLRDDSGSGTGVSTDTLPSYRCECPPPYDGPSCEVRQNPCVWPADPGPCDQRINRFYYDILSQQCLPFIFSGCGGNVNNYYNIEECTSIAMTGACCSRSFNTSIQAVQNSSQHLEISCEVLHIVECKALHRQPSGSASETEVISFNPGLTCEEAACQTRGVCVVGQRVYQPGQVVKLGCQTCTCKPMGVVDCKCDQVYVRKELRDMTPREIARFQAAVAELRFSEDRTWEQFRDLYMYHVMHATGGLFFLPWQRAFLRQMEQRLQEIDCSIVLPYSDFTTDVGFFEEAILWQPSYFGGNGDGRCVEDHRFGNTASWKPCVVRNFNTSIQLPTQLELQLALASDSFEEMSLCLETYAAYVHNFIGGDMMTSSSPYDPVFYAVHAYVDMLYWTWQQREPNKLKFPAGLGNVPMIPFNIPPAAVLDSEADVCVTYALPSQGHPCNLTSQVEQVPRRRRPERKRSDVDPWTLYGQEEGETRDQEVNLTDPLTFGKDGKGFNRDGYDKSGFDRGGFNRYGLDKQGFDRYGFDVRGLDRGGQPDATGRFTDSGYDSHCLGRDGLTREGFDQYGFSMDGLDVNGCSFHFNGPFSPLHSFRIARVLGRQPKHFLMSLARTCTGLSPLPTHWLHLNWIANTKDVSDMIEVELPDMQTGISSRFCFDTRPFLTSCDCDVESVTCEKNPCHNVTCDAFPEAECRIDLCADCQATWYHMGLPVNCAQTRGKLSGHMVPYGTPSQLCSNQGVSCQATWYHMRLPVNCAQTRDHCVPSPCEHGGTCRVSTWQNEPHLVTCDCPPGYDGPLCQYQVVDVCTLPLRTGSCDRQEQRWYYNHRTRRCEHFTYLGCRGNANNFRSIQDCQARCVQGSCCTRRPKSRTLSIGFDSQGYDRYGFNSEGVNRFGDRRTVENSSPTGKARYDSDGFDWQGFDRLGYDGEGLNRAGYNREGFDEEGFNITGYSRIGEYDGIIDYDEKGYDAEGYNRAGLSCHGHDRRGLDIFSVASAFTYGCEMTTETRCHERAKSGEHVVKFTPGKTCPERGCDLPCHCRHGNRTYTVYQQLYQGCQLCMCTETGSVRCACSKTFRRKEVREMTTPELNRYQAAVRNLTENSGYPSQWYQLASEYAEHKPLAVGNPLFLPWTRQYLRHVEAALQENDCDIAIPYYDWTVDAGKPYKSLVWAANMFGGDGSNSRSDRSQCVRYHPFKSYHPPYLSPCLRRHFNVSVSLPTVINVELALRDPDFERFRLQMEYFLRTFQTFVGGHMDSDFAPYDPIFLSVAAFMDKLWTQWQERHPQGLLDFPLDLRYVRMDPFKTVPDDVFDSKAQLCVHYIPLTEGAPCVIREVIQYGYDARGYDRHGYNKKGFDIDGYDIEGFDISGSPDRRGKYNTDGFDREGFGRSGYDSSGIDRYGFYIDSFNLDNFDSYGHDKSGYNRYGFDYQGLTPFGYTSNGSYMPNVDVTELGIFDKYGYNKYGFNAEGFDRNGFDIFGFDSRGFDRRECNYYSIGPVHILVKRYIERDLEDLNITDLNSVKRICTQLRPLPDYVVKRYWLDRDGQADVLDGIYDYQIRRNLLDTTFVPRESSVTTDSIWLPIAPDERLCLVTNIYTECRVGEDHVMCPQDMCVDRFCPGQPDAVCRVSNCGTCELLWYDGITGQRLTCSGCVDDSRVERREAETWSDGPCTNCVCRGGRVSCGRQTCPEITCGYPVQEPGDCCPTCDGCLFEGEIILSGSDFRLRGDPCTSCRCQGGNVTCSKVECPDMRDCQSSYTAPGACCPVCQDCGDRASGERWRPDPCQDCQCQSGHVVCEQTICESVKCQHPVSRRSECCPVCSECLYQGRLRRNGEEFSTDPCNLCTCRNGSVSCDTVACPGVTCDNPITLEGECCPGCNHDCNYEGVSYADSTNFQPDFNPCLNCTCVNSIVRCRNIRCPQMDPPCRSPVRRPGECCATICLTCEDDGIVYQDGDSWPSHNSPCELCTCRGGKVECRPRQACPNTCSHGLIRENECCSECTDCLLDGRVIPAGQVLTLSGGDTCRQCLCQAGSVRCRAIQPSRDCPLLQCAYTETAPGKCCPVCSGCNHEGQEFKDGEVISRDECSVCFCREGQVMCDSKRDQCPPVTCRRPVTPPGECCPVCTTCDHGGQEYRDGQTVLLLKDGCRKCTCQRGRLNCVSMSESDCPPVLCSHPGKRRNQCCPTCSSCRYKRRMVRNGQRFTEPDDKCQRCQCKDGSVSCHRMSCPETKCPKPVTLPGECCPVCASVCIFEGRQYSEGETFQSPKAECHTCTCENELVSCRPKPCEVTRCRNPARRPGECCATCDFCTFDRRTFRNQQRFVHPQDMCQQCACEFGTVTCNQTACPALTCERPVPMAGSCCPVCPKQCNFRGLRYDDGETFKSPLDQCVDCICSQGEAQCKRRMCPPVDCDNPVIGDCCPICSDCRYGSVVLLDGQTMADPEDPCRTCKCLRGSVRCRSVTCAPITCTNPVQDRCCPVCEGCVFRGRRYRNNQEITDTDSCEVCQCQDGSVQCRALQCPPTRCLHPARENCCPECRNCEFQGKMFMNGERFRGLDRDACEECQCSNGNVRCQPVVCPAVTCTHPVQGRCCAACRDCLVDGRVVREGELVSPDDPCEECRCRMGSVTCQKRQCASVRQCRHPVQGECCPSCSGCLYEGSEYKNGEVFASPATDCITCQCSYGTVRCRQKTCPEVRCSNPVLGECCLECAGCSYDGRSLENNSQFPHPSDPCQNCVCQDGNVRCAAVDCARETICSHPVTPPGECCPLCGLDCQYEGKLIKDGDRFDRDCKTCVCNGGDIRCSPVVCPQVACSHPDQDGCCRVCTSCLVEGTSYREGQTFPDPRIPCNKCQCQAGSVRCEREVCPPVSCKHPDQGQCCPRCLNCEYQGLSIVNGLRFAELPHACSDCICEFGTVTCERRACPADVTCRDPGRDQCGCPSCDVCQFDGQTVPNSQTVPNPTNPCSECTCLFGTITCKRRACSANVTCRDPGRDQCGCPSCDSCELSGRTLPNKRTIPNPEDPCSECTCMSGTVTCKRRACPVDVTCRDPGRDQCGCPSCEDCEFKGRIVLNAQTVPDPEDSCLLCTCQLGTVTCEPKTCSEVVTCRDPGRDQCGCPSCDVCQFKGQTVPNSQTVLDPADPCSECTCLNGSVTCARQSCPRVCSHPASRSGCCPRCEDCLFESSVRLEGQSFISAEDPCQKCICRRGSVICQTMDCPQPSCLEPIKMENECCPSCPICVYQDETYQDNERFNHPQDPCQSCSCQMGRVTCERRQCEATCTHPRQDLCCPKCDQCQFEGVLYDNGASFQPDDCRSCSCKNGNVVCDERPCPTLLCPNRKKVEGQCCEVCQGCTFFGVLYDDGASWVKEDSPCTVCTCNSGLVTCLAKDCFAPCSDPVTPPGQCCPECPTCNFNGIMYSDGQKFSPNGDPCDVCVCQNGRLRCEHNNCPGVASCPQDSIRQADPGACCATCIQEFTTGCSREDLGKVSRPRAEDPCFICECKEDFMWLCQKEECPVLSCPPDVQIYSVGKCCPACPPCFDVSDASFHLEGDQWSAKEDPCLACSCISGQVQCRMQQCDPISCRAWEQAVIPEGQCCTTCQPLALSDASCTYHGKSFQAGDEWASDECTSCSCLGGQVSCNVRQCAELRCKKDETPVTTPGQCCPVCKKEPGTCVVFGDPHYRTFDGVTLHFQGTCRYIMAKDCHNDLFSVEVQHDNRGVRGEVAWAQNLTVEVAGARVDLLQDLGVKVNGQTVVLPYLYEPHILVERSGQSLLLTTELGLRVLWDGQHYGEVTVPGSFKGKLCGLCGNFNSFPQDDLRLRSGHITNSHATFGNSWKASTQLSGACADGRDFNPCRAASYRTRKMAASKCSILKSAVFSRCHRVVPPGPYLDSCRYDLCACLDEQVCLCDVIATYARECARAGVKVEWRTRDLCAFSCDESKGLVFDECGPVCPRTCATVQATKLLQGNNTTIPPAATDRINSSNDGAALEHEGEVVYPGLSAGGGRQTCLGPVLICDELTSIISVLLALFLDTKPYPVYFLSSAHTSSSL
ncbi:hypothetical protein RRG08_016329 [Elysia crispata]|uniref:Kielin/chordin-like protein n=1 Tax=Elysia crispata TaxID=231223 RepID=A0AAE1AM08_9GAST|nr:hypothetical protein RRG08_016329 [Elysia crispata]